MAYPTSEGRLYLITDPRHENPDGSHNQFKAIGGERLDEYLSLNPCVITVPMDRGPNYDFNLYDL